MARHLMVDLETLATSPDAVILTIGAVTFDPASNKIFDKLYYRVDVESCDRLGMTVNDDTVEWWSKQAADVQTEAFAELPQRNSQVSCERYSTAHRRQHDRDSLRQRS